MPLSANLPAKTERLPAGCVERCPGCPHRALNKQESESRKHAWLRERLSEWRPQLVEVRGAIEEERWSYRQKTTLHAQWRQDHWAFGLLPKGVRRQEAEVIEIPDCPVHSKRVREVLSFLSRELPDARALPLCAVLVAGGLVTLVIKARAIDPELLERLRAMGQRIAPLGVEGLFVNLHPSAGDRILSSRGWVLLWGERLARSEEGFIQGPDSFQQLVPKLYRDALSEAARFLAPEKGDSVVDLYSGIGISLKLWKDSGARAIGVELGGQAAECSALNAPGVESLRGRAADRLPQLDQWIARGGRERLVVFANPPRLGLEPEVLDWLGARARPQRVAYLSCSAGTLARDLGALARAGYAVRRIIPYDFFPQTHHIEALALLERAENLDPAPGFSRT